MLRKQEYQKKKKIQKKKKLLSVRSNFLKRTTLFHKFVSECHKVICCSTIITNEGKDMETDVKTRRSGKREGRKLSKEEFRALLPERINKFGEWLLANRNAWDFGNGKIIPK